MRREGEGNEEGERGPEDELESESGSERESERRWRKWEWVGVPEDGKSVGRGRAGARGVVVVRAAGGSLCGSSSGSIVGNRPRPKMAKLGRGEGESVWMTFLVSFKYREKLEFLGVAGAMAVVVLRVARPRL